MDEARARAVRLRRLGMAAASYAFTLGMGVGCVAAGLLPWRLFAVYAAGVVGANLAFYALIHSGWSRRLEDPSLTRPQIVGAMLLHMVPMSHGGAVRGPLLILAALPFLYGLFRLGRAQLMALGACYVGGYLAFLAALRAQGQVLDPAVETLRTLALA
ncbi:MAG: hypothetical protein R3263_02580, partial [Myxococcota bacterium]|nr:hypothetical protein [Myxococcota bacterium]